MFSGPKQGLVSFSWRRPWPLKSIKIKELQYYENRLLDKTKYFKILTLEKLMFTIRKKHFDKISTVKNLKIVHLRLSTLYLELDYVSFYTNSIMKTHKLVVKNLPFGRTQSLEQVGCPPATDFRAVFFSSSFFAKIFQFYNSSTRYWELNWGWRACQLWLELRAEPRKNQLSAALLSPGKPA